MLKILFHHHKSKAFAQKSLVLLASLMGLAVVLLALAMALPAPLHARSAHLALLVWIAGVYVLLELKVTEKKLAHVLLLGLYGHFIYISFYSGGVHSPAMSWLLVLHHFVAGLTCHSVLVAHFNGLHRGIHSR